jgi:hypothetical protein
MTASSHIKLPESNSLLLVRDSVNKNYGPYLKYSKYGAFTILSLNLIQRLRTRTQTHQVTWPPTRPGVEPDACRTHVKIYYRYTNMFTAPPPRCHNDDYVLD